MVNITDFFDARSGDKVFVLKGVECIYSKEYHMFVVIVKQASVGNKYVWDDDLFFNPGYVVRI